MTTINSVGNQLAGQSGTGFFMGTDTQTPTTGQIARWNGTTWSPADIPVEFKAPAVNIFTSGSGTYTTPTSPAPLYLRVQMVGAGGGGGGSGAEGFVGGSGGTGGTTSFGTSLLTCLGGVAGGYADVGGAPGTSTINAGASGSSFSGSWGGAASEILITAASGAGDAFLGGGYGGSGFFGGSGSGGYNSAGKVGSANTGAGGGGGGTLNSTTLHTGSGSGGGSGSYIDAIIDNPSSTYSYSIGAGGTAGAAGGGGTGYAGGAGAAGIIIVTEYYQ